MKTLRFFRFVFVLFVLGALLGAAFNSGWHNGEVQAVKSLESADKFVGDPESPKEAYNFCLKWALYFGIGGTVCQTIIWAKRRQKKATRRAGVHDAILERLSPPFRPDPMRQWRRVH
jgi:hypothetical protein